VCVDCHSCWSRVDRDAFPDSPALTGQGTALTPAVRQDGTGGQADRVSLLAGEQDYFGLFCATTLILRVIVAIMHDGLS
jgi:hypothetical protein